MAGGQQLPEQYTVPQYARIFHSLPHLNVSLHSVNNTFNPHSEIYLEVGRSGEIRRFDLVQLLESFPEFVLRPIPHPPARLARGGQIDLVDLKQSASD